MLNETLGMYLGEEMRFPSRSVSEDGRNDLVLRKFDIYKLEFDPFEEPYSTAVRLGVHLDGNRVSIMYPNMEAMSDNWLAV